MEYQMIHINRPREICCVQSCKIMRYFIIKFNKFLPHTINTPVCSIVKISQPYIKTVT
jgi:hypothetical protein